MLRMIFSFVMCLIGLVFCFVGLLMFQAIMTYPENWENIFHITGMNPLWIPVCLFGGGLVLIITEGWKNKNLGKGEK